MPDHSHSDCSKGIALSPLISGRLAKRYKRFLADVILDDGREVTAHCPNSGRMIACSQPGRPVYLSEHDNPRRKLKYTWELISMPTSLVGVNTQLPNRLAAHAIGCGQVRELTGYSDIQREVRVGEHSRLDIRLHAPEKKTCFVEVKNCTLVEDGVARFPDAVTTRGRKHLAELSRLVRTGHRAVMFYLIQRMDAVLFRPADDIDPAYGEALRAACADGVEIVVYDVTISLAAITLNRPVEFKI
jgi:sugar fermentation stimulation protein A